MAGTPDFRNRVVLVTGVGRVGQIGNAVALAFGKAGAKLVVADLNAVGVAERAREFAALPDIAALAVEMAVKGFGRLDVVVNLAGGLTTYGPIERTTARDFDREIAINLKTTFLVSRAAIQALAATRGAIVNVASIAVLEPQAPLAAYVAAKAGIAGFTRSLALELRDRGIRVNAVAPGMVRTGDNVAAVGASAAYVELSAISDGILSLADPASTTTGAILPIKPSAS